jgi:hypothetical protein
MGVRKKRGAIIIYITIATFTSPATSSHLSKYLNTPVVDEWNGDG